MYKEIIFNIETGEQTIREYTATEMKEAEKEEKEAANRVKELQAKQTTKNAAIAKLAALGLTEDEIAAL